MIANVSPGDIIYSSKINEIIEYLQNVSTGHTHDGIDSRFADDMAIYAMLMGE